MSDDWIKVRGATPTEKKNFELKARLKHVGIAFTVLVLLVILFYAMQFFTYNPNPGAENSLCKTSNECNPGLCCGGYVSNSGPDAGHGHCRDETKYACFDK